MFLQLHGEKLVFLEFLGSDTQIKSRQNTVSTRCYHSKFTINLLKLLVDLVNLDMSCFSEVAWILEDVKLICEQFVSISFINISLKCNSVTLALTSVIKENKEIIVWL